MRGFFKIIVVAGLLSPVVLCAQEKQDPQGCLTYSLPMTVISIEVDAVQESFYAGPYAKYAEKYLGMEVRQQDEIVCHLVQVRMSSSVEADLSKRYSLFVEKGTIDASFLKLSASGLVSFGDMLRDDDVKWSFPIKGNGDFSAHGISSNLTSEAAVLYKNDKKNKVAVNQNIIVTKSLEQKAAEAAQMILDVRKQRLQIVVGDTDATYSGEALGAAVAELTRLEEEYLMLFTGYSERQSQKFVCEVIPDSDRESQRYIAFRMSDSEGIVTADNLTGKPVILELVPQEIAQVDSLTEKQVKKSPASLCYYRIPTVCDVKLTEGQDVLIQTRMPVYQLGHESTLPINVILK